VSTSHSRTLLTGWKSVCSFQVMRPGFFSSGVTCACLNLAGNFPVCIDRLASLATIGEKTSAHVFSSEHGNTSSGDDLGGMADNSRRTSSVVTGWNDDSDSLRYGLSVKTCRAVDCSTAAMLLRCNRPCQ